MDHSAPAAANDQKKNWSRVGSILLRVLALLAVIAISVWIYQLPRDRVKELASFGYVGIFLISILANATIFLPAPGVAFVFSMGAVFNPILVALAAGAGASLGELSGYLAGFSGQKVAERTALITKLEGWMKKYGGWIILILAFVPNPFFDLAGMIAGMLKMPLRKFLFFCFIGKTLKMLLFAYFGSLSIPWLTMD
jgi:membrane protein DedA with SNARE-associated domain